jgi:hypothetical protein
MVVSRDWPEISVLECILGGLDIGVDIESCTERASLKLRKSKIDALIVDCDLPQAEGFLGGLRESGFEDAVPLVVMGSSWSHPELQDSRHEFVFRKPISVDQAVRTLSAARTRILKGRLSYHRQPLETRISVAYGGKHPLEARLLNLSQSGMRVQADGELPGNGSVELNFALPDSPVALQLEGEVVWQNQQGEAGIRFARAEDGPRRNLKLWLERQYLTR